MPYIYRRMTALLVLLGSQGCGGGYATPALFNSETTRDANTVATPTVSKTDFTWASGAKTVLVNKCGACHPSLDATFNAAVLAEVKKVYTDILQQIATDAMPLGEPLDAATKAQLVAWGKAGNP